MLDDDDLGGFDDLEAPSLEEAESFDPVEYADRNWVYDETDGTWTPAADPLLIAAWEQELAEIDAEREDRIQLEKDLGLSPGALLYRPPVSEAAHEILDSFFAEEAEQVEAERSAKEASDREQEEIQRAWANIPDEVVEREDAFWAKFDAPLPDGVVHEDSEDDPEENPEEDESDS